MLSEAGECSLVYGAHMHRRDFLIGAGAVPLALAAPVPARPARAAPSQTPAPARAPIRQSVMSSVGGRSPLSFEERCRTLARIGFKGVDLPGAPQVPILRDHGLAPTMMTGTGTSFRDGLIRREMPRGPRGPRGPDRPPPAGRHACGPCRR